MQKKQIMELLRQKNAHDMAALCSGLGLGEALTEKLLYLVTCRGKTQEVLAGVEALLQTQQEREAFAELKNLCTYLEQSGYADNVRVDFSVGSDMKYYSGVVFKGYLEGVFGTILSGGQYDRLLQRMGRKGSAVGFAVYVDLLRAKNESNDDVDTLILTDPDVPTAVILAAAEAAGKDGTVLVCREKPQGRSWRQIVDLRKERNQ